MKRLRSLRPIPPGPREGKAGVRGAGLFLMAAALLAAGCSDGEGRTPDVGAYGADRPGAQSGPQEAGAWSPAASEPLPRRFGFGRPATPAEVRALDIDIMPDGRGLPPGSGTAAAGAAVYRSKCASCHGVEGEGGSANRLVRAPGEVGPAGGRTIGAYWPYATTAFDYIRRSMPFDAPGSLDDKEVWDVVAWLLARNGLVPEDAVVDARGLPLVEMPNRPNFVRDDREAHTVVR